MADSNTPFTFFDYTNMINPYYSIPAMCSGTRDSVYMLNTQANFMETCTRINLFNPCLNTPMIDTTLTDSINAFWAQTLEDFKNGKCSYNQTMLPSMPNLYATVPQAGTTTTTQTGASNLSASDQKLNAKNNRLLNVLKNVLKCLDQNSEAYSDLNIAIGCYTQLSPEEEESTKAETDPKSKYQIYYEHLKTIYDGLDKDLIKESIINYGTIDNKNIKALLEQTGYESDGITLSVGQTEITNVKSAINGASDSNANINNDTINKVKFGTIPVLEFVSGWNSVEKKNVIEFMAGKLNDIKDKDAKNEYINSTIKPLVEALSKETDKQVKSKYLTDATKEALRTQNVALSDIISKINGKNCKSADLKTLATEFEKLYIALRTAETESLENRIATQYEFLNDEELFEENEFVDEMKEDLDGENLNNIGDIQIDEGGNVVINGNEQVEDQVQDNGGQTAVTYTAQQATDINTKINAYNLSDEDKNAARKSGKILGRRLIGYSGERCQNDIREIIDKVNSRNILEVMAGYDGVNYHIVGDSLFLQLYRERGFNKEGEKYGKHDIIKKLATCLKENLEARRKIMEAEGKDTDSIDKNITSIKEILEAFEKSEDSEFTKDQCKKLDEIADIWYKKPQLDNVTATATEDKKEVSIKPQQPTRILTHYSTMMPGPYTSAEYKSKLPEQTEYVADWFQD